MGSVAPGLLVLWRCVVFGVGVVACAGSVEEQVFYDLVGMTKSTMVVVKSTY